MMEYGASRTFSTPWKIVFHTVENFAPRMSRARRPQACHAMGVEVNAEDYLWMLAESIFNS